MLTFCLFNYQNNFPRCEKETIKTTSFSRRHQFDGTDAGFRNIPCEKWSDNTLAGVLRGK